MPRRTPFLSNATFLYTVVMAAPKIEYTDGRASGGVTAAAAPRNGKEGQVYLYS
jgi:hypothetical protein